MLKNMSHKNQEGCGTNGQCVAPLNNKRCINTPVGDSNHCSLHRPKAISLYKKYKIACEEAEQYDLNKEFSNDQDKVNYIMTYYIKLNNAYNARQKHRTYAFVPECFDTGHLHQFVKLNNQMVECEKILDQFQPNDVEVNNDCVEKEPKNSITIKQKENNRKIKSFKQNRIKQEADINQLIDHYIHENSILLKKRSKLMGFITTCIDTLYEEIDPNEDIEYFVKHIVSYNLVVGLYRWGYFESNFKPDKCSDITCGCYVPYDIKLACACVLNNHSVNTYFNMISEKSLHKYYELVLIHKNKILPLFEDVINLYDEHEDTLMFLKVHLVWHHDLKRLVLEPNTYEDLPKMSKIMAQSRLKDKFYHQKMQQEYLTGKSSLL